MMPFMFVTRNLLKTLKATQCIRKKCSLALLNVKYQRDNNVKRFLCMNDALSEILTFKLKCHTVANCSGAKLGSTLPLNADHNSLTNAEIVTVIKNVHKYVYKQVSGYPWAIEDETLLFVQASLSKECEILFNKIQENVDFNRLCNRLLSNSSSLNDHELLSATKCLLSLQVPASSPLMTQLVSLCIERIPNFSLEYLALLSDAADYLKRSGMHLKGKIICRFQEIIEDEKITVKSYDQIAHILFNLSYFFSKDYLHNILNKVIPILNDADNPVDANSSCYYVESVLYGDVPLSHDMALAFLKNIIDNVENLSLWRLFRISKFCKFNYIYDDAVINVISQCGLQKLNVPNLNSADIVLLSGIFQLLKIYDDNCLHRLTNLIEKNVINFDSILIKYFCPQRRMLTSDKINWLFQHTIQSRLPELFSSVACLMTVLSYLLKRQESQTELDNLLCCGVLKSIENGQFGSDPNHLAVIGAYLLKNKSSITHSIPVLTGMLNDTIPQFSLEKLVLLQKEVIVSNVKNMSSFYFRRLKSLQLHLMSSIINHTKEISSLDTLNFCIENIDFQQRNEIETEFAHHASEAYSRLLSQVNFENARKTCFCVKKLKLYIPELFQVIFDEMLKHRERLDVETLYLILTTLATANYHPINSCALKKTVTDLWKMTSVTKENFGLLLRTLYAMAIFDIFPEELLLKIFSVDCLLQFDDLCGALDLKELKHLRRMLFYLNRSAIISCPELDLPWFHENYHEDGRLKSMENEVKDYLEKELGREQYFKSNTGVSEYGHTFDGRVKSMENEVKDYLEKELGREQYFKSNTRISKYRHKFNGRVTSMENEVKDYLEKVLGGKQYLKSNKVLSEYGHRFDFECALDKYQNPIIVTNNEYSKQYDLTRIAINIMWGPSYTMNNKHNLLGSVALKLRELEILGYKVVQIPYFEIQSMFLNDENAKFSYFRKKIFH